MEQPPGFIQTDSSLVCRLMKSLYGVKKTPQAWYAKMDSFILDTDFCRCHSNNIVCTNKMGKSLIILVIYVDDHILICSDPNLKNHVKSNLKNQFEITDLGHLHYFLGLQVFQSKEGISLSQSKNACDLLPHFDMEYCKLAPYPFESRSKLLVTCTSPKVHATLYCQLVGKLLYGAHTHLDISFLVGLIARFMQNSMKVIGKQLKAHIIMFEVYFSFGFITVYKHLLYWLVSLILTGLVTRMIGSLLQVMSSLVVLDLLHGLARNKVPFLFLQQKQSFVVSQKLVRSPCGFVRYCQSLAFNSSIRLHFGVIIKIPFNYTKIQSNISTENTLNSTCISS